MATTYKFQVEEVRKTADGERVSFKQVDGIDGIKPRFSLFVAKEKGVSGYEPDQLVDLVLTPKV